MCVWIVQMFSEVTLGKYLKIKILNRWASEESL
jgi:hypothetical protein